MMKKRILASLLSLCLLVGLLPTAALAAGEGDTEPVCASLEGCAGELHDEECPLYTPPTTVIPDSDTTPVTTTSTGDSGTPVPMGSGTETEAVKPDTSWYTDAGEGAKEFTISDVADLLGLAVITQNKAGKRGDLADDFANKTVTLAENLNLADVPWFVQESDQEAPSVDYRIAYFAGTFDGGNHTISNLSFTSEKADEQNCLGLFHSITNTGVVKDLTLDTVTVSLSASDRFGSLAYQFLGRAENCHVKHIQVEGAAGSTYEIIGGMFAMASSYDSGTGTAHCAACKNCSVTDLDIDIDGSLKRCGGLIAHLISQATLEDCHVTDLDVDVSSALYYGGGMLGSSNVSKTEEITKFTSCSVSGADFTAEVLMSVGGFSGQLGEHTNQGPVNFQTCTVTDVSFTCSGDKTEMGWVGGFSGTVNWMHTYTDCTVNGVTISKAESEDHTDQVGGFAGNAQNAISEENQDKASSFTNCHVKGLQMTLAGPELIPNTSEYQTVGGFLGKVTQGGTRFNNCTVSGEIDTTGFKGYTGGFVGALGWNDNYAPIEFENCRADVHVVATADAGGFIGLSSDALKTGIKSTLIVKDCTAKGSVTSVEGAAGGFVGAGDRGTYTDCTADGVFVSGVTAGGFWGEIFPLKVSGSDFTVSITGCKAYNSVQGSSHAAGFLGYADTVSADSSKTTSVTIKSSAASPAVTGTASDTAINCFLNKSEDSNITLGSEDSDKEANTSSITIARPDDSNGKIELDKLNGDMEIKDDDATATRCQLQAEDKSLSLPVGSVIHRDGSITIPGSGDDPGSTIDPEGTQRTHGVLTVSPDSNTVYSNAGTTSFTYTYNGDGAVTAKSSNSGVATASVSGNKTVIVTIHGTGTARITVSATQTNEYTAASDVHVLTVRQYTSSSGSSGSSSSGTTTYPITVEDSRNGEAESSRRRAERGDTITITVEPEEGYELDELIVTDKNGDAVKLTDKGDGEYTFTMPRSAVTVEATFRAVEPATPAWDECGRGPDCPAYHFTDLNLSLWYHDGIHFCVEHGLMNGTSATTFEPDTTTSRGMIVTILYRLEGTPAAGASSFTDVAAGAYYADAVAWANANGIVMGYGNGKYGPDDPVTREQLAAILYRYAQYKGYDTTQGGMSIREFSDYEQISDYALEPMAWAVNAGLINGTTSTTLAPTGSGTRAQTAALLMRFCENIAK